MHYLVILGAAVNLFGIAHYIHGVFRRKIRPNLVTWILWAIAPLVASAAAFSAGVRWAVLPTFMIGFCPLLVVISAFLKKRSIWQATKFSYFCGCVSLISLFLWVVTQEPQIAVVFAIVSDGLAALPTLEKTWRFPDTESGIAYIAMFLNILSSFSVTRLYTFSELGFPVYSALLHLVLISAVYGRRLAAKTNKAVI